MKRLVVLFVAVLILFSNVPIAAAFSLPHFSLNSQKVSSTNSSDYKAIHLGKKKDPKSGKWVEGITFVSQNTTQIPESTGSAVSTTGIIGGPFPVTVNCHTNLVDGAKWKTVEPWVINATNSEGISKSTVVSIVNNSITKWEDAADMKAGDGHIIDIVGIGSQTGATLNSNLDGVNTVRFGKVEIAPGQPAPSAPTIWGIFDGPLENREIVEWDLVLNDVDYNWATNGDPNKDDVENVVTHELGHVMGLGDLYDDTFPGCQDATMFGFTANGETKKRTLEQGDQNGIAMIYSPVTWSGPLMDPTLSSPLPAPSIIPQ